jgi:membrane protein DedA with SNARE-associated domain
MKALFSKISAALIAFGPLGVFVLSFLDSVGAPLPAALDALLLFLAVKAPGEAYFSALLAVIGSVAGNTALFLMARFGRRRLSSGELPPGRRRRFQEWFHRYGLLTVFIPCVVPFVPLPLKFFVITAGVLHISYARFVLVVLAARSIRYFGETYLGVQLGEGAQTFLVRNVWVLLVVLVIAGVGVYAVLRARERRGENAV